MTESQLREFAKQVAREVIERIIVEVSTCEDVTKIKKYLKGCRDAYKK